MDSEINISGLADMQSVFLKQSPARDLLLKLFDPQSFSETDTYAGADQKPCGAVTGFGYIGGSPVYAYVQDSTVSGGAVGRAHAEKVKKLYELAAKTGAPVMTVFDSNGGNIAEGNDLLAAYGDMLAASNALSGVVPQIAIVTGTCGITAAMLACGMDIVIMTEDAEMFTSVNKDSSAENAEQAGAVHIITKDIDSAVLEARKLLSILPGNNLSGMSIFESPGEALPVTEDKSGKSLAESVCDRGSLVPIQLRFGSEIFTGLCTVSGFLAGILATEKDKKLSADSMEKCARFVRFCDAFNIPVLTFVDTRGIADGETAVSNVRSMAKLANALAEATVSKVCVVTGESCGAPHIALAGTANDIVLAWENAVISPLAPEAAVEFLWHDRLKGAEDLAKARESLVNEYKKTLASPFAAAANGYVNDVILPKDTRAKVASALDMLTGKRVSKLPKKHGNNTI